MGEAGGATATSQPGLAGGVSSTPSTSIDPMTNGPLLGAIDSLIVDNLKAMVPLINNTLPQVDNIMDKKLAAMEDSLFKRLREDVLEQTRDGSRKPARSPSSSPMWTRSDKRPNRERQSSPLDLRSRKRKDEHNSPNTPADARRNRSKD
ncbi:unnamed protein product, partial [Pylaiella littoralis]